MTRTDYLHDNAGMVRCSSPPPPAPIAKAPDSSPGAFAFFPEVIFMDAITNGAAPAAVSLPLVPCDAAGDGRPVRRATRPNPILLLPAERYAALRRAVETTTRALSAIAADFALAPRTLARMVEKEAWPRPYGAPVGKRLAGVSHLARATSDAGMVRARLLRAVDRQIAAIDRRTRERGSDVEEKDARTLGILAKTLETVMALAGGTATPLEREPADRERTRAALAEKIARWAEEEREESA